MRTRRLLLATAALAIGCGGSKKKEPEIYANPKGTHYDKGMQDAGVDAAPDAQAVIVPPPEEEIHANPKGAFYDNGLANKPATK